LEEEFLKYEKIFIKDEAIVSELVIKVAEKLNMDESKVKIYIKKTTVDVLWVADLINSDKN